MHPYPESAVQAPLPRSFVVTWLLSWLLGGLGVDRFYLGKVGTGLLKLVTFGGFGIWYLIDLILVLAGAARDTHGQPLEGSRSSRTVAWVVTAAAVVVGGVMTAVLGAVSTTVVQETAGVEEEVVVEEDDDDVEEEDATEPEDEEAVRESDEEDADVEEDADEDEADDAEDAEEEATAPEDDEPEDEEPAADEPDGGQDAAWISDQFGEFEPVEESGAGDSVISLPGEADGGIVTAEHSGGGNFALTVLDAANQSTGELLVNTIGQYSGATAWGVSALGDGETIQVTADGAWTVTIQPFSTAEPMPESGSGDGVFLYEGGAGTLQVTHSGQSNFVVREETDQLFNLGLLINEIGAYEGSVPMQEGPSLIMVEADGSWTLSTG